jgi:hypothetical protein
MFCGFWGISTYDTALPKFAHFDDQNALVMAPDACRVGSPDAEAISSGRQVVKSDFIIGSTQEPVIV